MDESPTISQTRRRHIWTGILIGVTVAAVAVATVAFVQGRSANDRAAVSREEATRADEAAESERIAREEADQIAADLAIALQEAEDLRRTALAAEEDAAFAELQAVAAAELAHARALTAGAVAVLGTDPELAVLLASEAVEIDPGDPAGLATLREALERHSTVFAIPPGQETTPPDIAAGSLSPDGRYLVLSSPGNAIEVWDLDRPASPIWARTFPGDDVEVADPSFSDDGTRIFALVRWSHRSVADPPPGHLDAVRILDTATGADIRRITTPPCLVGFALPGQQHVQMDGPLFVVGNVPAGSGCNPYSFDVGYLDPDGGAYVPLSEPVGPGPGWPTASADGKYVAIGMDGPGEVIDAARRRTVFSPGGGVSTLAPDGSVLVSGGIEGAPLSVWTVPAGDLVNELAGTQGAAEAWFTSDGSLISVLSAEGPVMLFDATTLRLTRTLPAPAPPGHHIVSEDGTRVAVFGADGSVRVLMTGDEIRAGTIISDLDPEELISHAGAWVTRSFTDSECLAYAIAPCPSLDDLRSR